jgi:hypothetical protein
MILPYGKLVVWLIVVTILLVLVPAVLAGHFLFLLLQPPPRLFAPRPLPPTEGSRAAAEAVGGRF